MEQRCKLSKVVGEVCWGRMDRSRKLSRFGEEMCWGRMNESCKLSRVDVLEHDGEEVWRVQGALGAFGSVCEAIVSWRHIRCEGLRNEISQLMSAYKHELQSVRALLEDFCVLDRKPFSKPTICSCVCKCLGRLLPYHDFAELSCSSHRDLSYFAEVRAYMGHSISTGLGACW